MYLFEASIHRLDPGTHAPVLCPGHTATSREQPSWENRALLAAALCLTELVGKLRWI